MNAASNNPNTGAGSLTLGELLYADPAVTRVSEKEWLALVRAIAAGDEAALRLLYEKTYAIVFTYLLRVTGDRDRTEQLILDVYQDIWCEAPVIDGADGPVLGWIMRLARGSAAADTGSGNLVDHARAVAGVSNDAILTGAGSRWAAEDGRLQVALQALTLHEREAIEATLLKGLSYAELAAQWQEPVGTIKSRVRSGLVKLTQALQAGADES